MKRADPQIERLVAEATARLIERAADARSLKVSDLSARVRKALDKYLFANDAEATADEIRGFVDALHADDLCLIAACERGDQTAWGDLVGRYEATVRAAARSAASNEDAAEDLAQSIWAELHGLKMREDGQPSGKIAYYSGRGSLGGWLRAVVGQLAVDQHRRQSRLVQTEEDADFDKLAQEARGSEGTFSLTHAAPDPEHVFSERSAASDVEEALAQVMRELAPEDRLLVKLYYFDGLKLREAGAVMGVHEATASRRLTRIHGEVRSKVETILMKEHGWTAVETARSLSEAATHLESDLELMLTSEKAKGEQRASQSE
ncbi:MAG TPA: sigma-70 family RNA polymerase sigma factor [Pyrinomonadaceae bacterium]|nr:sigma-70 family RNA polymerase sigma factor [Pyrinomonadaceae bacterium]